MVDREELREKLREAIRVSKEANKSYEELLRSLEEMEKEEPRK